MLNFNGAGVLKQQGLESSVVFPSCMSWDNLHFFEKTCILLAPMPCLSVFHLMPVVCLPLFLLLSFSVRVWGVEHMNVKGACVDRR